MAWASLASNQFVSRNDLQDAVTTGVFFLRPSQTIPAGNNFVTRSEVETWIYASVTSGASNQWPQKSWIIAIATTTTTTTTTSTTTTTVSPFRSHISYNGTYQIAYFCDMLLFPNTVYTTNTNPPYTAVYSDSALTTQYVGAAFINNTVTNYVSSWLKSSVGATGVWTSQSLRKISQTGIVNTLTANSGTGSYTQVIGESIYLRQGNSLSFSVNITATNTSSSSMWRVRWSSGGPNPSGSFIYTSAWTPVTIGSTISASNIVSTCDASFFQIEFDPATVSTGNFITINGSVTI